VVCNFGRRYDCQINTEVIFILQSCLHSSYFFCLQIQEAETKCSCLVCWIRPNFYSMAGNVSKYRDPLEVLSKTSVIDGNAHQV
jgi:hypothetical protein